MPLYNDTITLGVRADLTQFERDIANATQRAASRLKPLDLRLNDGVSQPLGKITGDISQFNKSLDAASARVLAFSASVGIINGVVNAFRDLIKETISVQKALTDINVVLNTNQQGLDKFGNSLFDIARNTASSFKDVTNAALEFSRQGLGIEETLKRTQAAMVLTRISGLDAAESVKALTTAMNGFHNEALDALQVVNKLASVDSNFAVSTKDLAEALTRVGSTANEAKVSFNELIAVVSAVQQTTARGGAVIGNALKTIFTRVGREDTIRQLRELGVAIDENQSGIEKLRAISTAVDRANVSTANHIKELSGGVFQINVVSAALGDLSKQYSVYDNALRIANSATDEAIRRNQALNQTLDALARQAGTNIEELLSKIGKISLGGNLKSVFAGFNDLAKSINDGLDGESIGSNLAKGILQGVGNFIFGPGGVVFLGFFSKIFLQVAKDATNAFRSIYGITGEQEKQAQLQSTIAQRLAANAALYEQQLLTGKGLVGVQQEIIAGLAREAEMRAAISRVATSTAAQYAGSVNVVKGQIIPKAATGYIPALSQESRDIMRGVGGAAPSAKPVYVPHFNFGDRSGPIVANTSERIVENWMGGRGSAVLNPEMIAALGGESKLGNYGKVKAVAEGYVPSFSSFDLAGGKVNLRKRGGDLILDEILAGFDAEGNRMGGTGIVRQAFDLAIEEGKKIGADNLVVDIINSKVASSLNNNPKFSQWGPFGIGKFKFPLMALADGFVPNLAPELFMNTGEFLGSGAFGKVFGNSRFPGLAFKDLRAAGSMGEIDSEYTRTKFAEQLGLPVAKVFGSLERSRARGGLYKQFVGGISGYDLMDIIGVDNAEDFRNSLQGVFKSKGLKIMDLHGENYKVNATADEVAQLVDSKGYAGAKQELLGKTVVIDAGQLVPKGSGAIDAFNSFKSSSGANFARGYVPNLASALNEAVSREIEALVKQGYNPQQAQDSIKVDSSSVLAGPQNPLGLGVFNTLQGQNSLTKAFTDHIGQNLKTTGAANGFVPNLAGQFEGFAQGELKNRQNKPVAIAVVDEINQLIDSITKSLDPKSRAADIQKITAAMNRLSDKSADVVANQLDKAVDFSAKNILAGISGKGLKGASGRQLGQAKLDEINELLRKAATTESPTAFGEITAQFAKLEKDVSKDTFEKLAKQFKQVTGFNEGARGTTRAAAEDIFEQANRQVNNRGFFSFRGVNSILSGQQGFENLPAEEQALLRQRLGQSASANRRESFGRASLGLAFAGSLASPFLDQGAASLRAGGNTAGAGALSTASGTLTGASLGVIFGPEGAAIGALVGGIISLGKAADGSASKAEELAKRLDDMQAKTSANLNGFSTFIQTQQKLNDIIEAGGKASDIAQVRSELTRIFSSISDPTLRQRIVDTGGSIKSLSEAFAKSQSGAFDEKFRTEAVALAAQERAKNTNFAGIRTQSTFSAGAINDISRALVASAPEQNLTKLADALKSLDANSSAEDFAKALDTIGLKADDAKSIFTDLEKPLNRLLLVRGLKDNIDLAKQFKDGADAAISYKKNITDLNKTLGALTALDVSNSRAALGFGANAFSVQQNASQNQSGLQFFNASQFAQAQLSTAFQASQIRFQGGQERETARLDFLQKLTNVVETNKDKIGSDEKLSTAINDFVRNGARGDFSQLRNQLITKGVGSGEDLKAFSTVAQEFTDFGNKLASIDDNEKTQITILRQNLDALKQRIQIENKVNLLGGAEGQLNFSRQGLERFGNRDANTLLQRLGGSLGAFGRNENAAGILDFQKAFGGIDGFDARKLIPNAQNQVADAIKQSLIEGFGRLNIPVGADTLKQFDSIAKISAEKQFERKELTADEIGKAVAGSFNYDLSGKKNEEAFSTSLKNSDVRAYTSAIPDIKGFLQARFGLEKDRADLGGQRAKLQTDIEGRTSTVSQLRADIDKIRLEGARSIRVPSGNIPFFNNSALRAADAADIAQAQKGLGASELGNLGPSDLATLLGTASGQLKGLIPSNGNLNDFRKNVNETVNGSGLFSNEFLKTAFLTQFGNSSFPANSRGQREISDQAFGQLVTALEKSGAVDLDPNAKAQIAQKTGQISDLEKTISPLQDKFKELTGLIDDLNKKIEGQNAAGPKPGTTPQGVAATTPTVNPSAQEFQRLSSVLPNVDLSPGFFQRFVASQKNNGPIGTDASRATFQGIQTRLNDLTFGSIDTGAASGLAQARAAVNTLGANNPDAALRIRDVQTRENAILRTIAEQQAVNGRANPELTKLVGGATPLPQTFQKLSSSNATQQFEEFGRQAREAFTSGFASESELTQLGLKINKAIEDHVRAQIRLGVPLDEARKAGEAMRIQIQKELDKLQVKLPTNKLQEFGQGFSSRIEEMQKSLDDFGQLGAQTADSLVNGFGDAFYEVASGAKSASDAVRGLLSSVLADISKFLAKRAIAGLFATAIGNGSAASFGGFANGGLVTRANGGTLDGVPALVMGGERAFKPETVRAFGVDFFKDLNAGKIQPAKFDTGGQIKGGSGNKDDLFHTFDPGTFILQKAAVNKYGTSFLDNIDKAAQSPYAKGGQIPHAFIGALLGAIFAKAITGAVAGAVVAKVTGGDWKKGAILGGIAGGIAGGVGGFSAAQGATGSFGSQFGNAFSNGFSYLGFGDKGAGAATETSTGSSSSLTGTNGLPSADSLKFNQTLPDLPKGGLLQQSLASLNGGNATGLGNQSLTLGQTQPNIWKSAGINLTAGLGLALASAALAPKQKGGSGSNIVQGNGSVTTYNDDGSVTINNAGGSKTIKRSEYTNSQQLEQLVSVNGGSLPQGGIPKFAGGGEVASGSGSVTYKERSILSQIRKQPVIGGYASGGSILPLTTSGLFSVNSGASNSSDDFQRPVNPLVSVGSGTKDDVKILGKQGEYMMKDTAVDKYGVDIMNLINAGMIDKSQLQQPTGVLTMTSGGPVGSSPADEKGLFSVTASPNVGGRGQEAPRGGGGGATSVEINIYMDGQGGATVSAKSNSTGKGDDNKGSVDSQKFAAKVKAMFLELIEQEKRPGGSLSKDNLS